MGNDKLRRAEQGEGFFQSQLCRCFPPFSFPPLCFLVSGFEHRTPQAFCEENTDSAVCFEEGTSTTKGFALSLVLSFGYKNSSIRIQSSKVKLCRMPIFMKIALTGFSLYRNDWEPPDKKVDTRKYRAEPKSIYEYQPGKSSVLTNEKMVMCILKFFCLTLPMFFNPDALCTWITFFLP